LVNIYFYNHLPIEKATVNLKQFVEVLEQHLNEVIMQKEQTEGTYNTKNNFRYSTIICGIYYFQSIIDWCNDLIKHLE